RKEDRGSQAQRTEEDDGSEDILGRRRQPDAVQRLLIGRRRWAVAASTPSWCAAAWRALGRRRKKLSEQVT
ncbi:MAG TPA: hypothetical protein VGZ51_05705, partial [Actinomycetota bacterium]|nr:hypothetical protein [Actinomycetota bacterium]